MGGHGVTGEVHSKRVRMLPDSSCVTGVKSALDMVRYLGLRWVVFRTIHTLKLRSGFFERRCPARPWFDYPLRKLISDPTLAEPERYLNHRRNTAPFFFFRPSDRTELGQLLRQFDGPESDPVRDAERIEQGEFTLFAHARVKCGFPPGWHRNPLAGQRAPADAHWSRIGHFAHGDIKCVWELGRFSFAYTLARAYWRAGDEKWAESFWRLVEDWREHNPPNRGPHWMCGQEITFRVMAWCFGLYAFLDAATTTPERVAALAQMLAVSGNRIAANFDYALSQASNHSISEAVGLWTLGVLFPEFRASAQWEQCGRYWLERLGRELIYDDGGFCQHSANYHRLMLHDYIWALRLAEIVGRPFSVGLKERVRRATDFLWSIQDDVSGGTPCYGANDGALVLPLDNCDYRDFRPVAQMGRFLTAGERAFEPGPWDEGLVWLFGPTALSAPIVTNKRADCESAESGVYTMRAPNTFVVVHCPRRFRHRPSHADLLHVDLWWNGVNVAIDPGTFSYNAPAPWDGALADTRFHNTVTVDGKDQMHRASRFLWLPWIGGEPGEIRSTATGNLKVWTGSYRSHCRHGKRAMHRRAVVWLGGIGWVIVDNIRKPAAAVSRCVLHWLLPESAEMDQGEVLRLKLDAAGTKLAFESGVLTGEMRWSVVRADPESPRGWRSAYYQHREPATSVQIEACGAEVMFWSYIGFADGKVIVRGDTISIENGDVRAELRSNPGQARVVRRGNELVEEMRIW